MADERDEEKFGKAEVRKKQQQTTGGAQELGEIGGEVDQPGSFAGGLSGRQAEIQGEGFIARASTDTDEYLQETGERQGAIENPPPTRASDVERERDRRDEKDSNIEGGVG
jgi:hypothetical protein